MKWRKLGLVWGPDGSIPWAAHSALTPTPVLLGNGVLRVYAGFRDTRGVSRIGFVDLDAMNPLRVLRVSREPVLNTGTDGAFDDNGVILGDIVVHEETFYMYYVGFQLVEKVKFLAFTGLAVSSDGESFERVSSVPVLDRSDEGIFIRAIHSVIVEGNIWRVWYACGDGWIWIDGKPFPQYHIRYLDSPDGVTFPDEGESVLVCEKAEYRVGRPRVIREGGMYRMFYTRGTMTGEYIPGYAESTDGVHWLRKDAEVGIDRSPEGWDSQMLCYPSIIRCEDRVYMFYNGNEYGRDGFGCAILEEW
ncbi:MAG: hypothetical protein QXI60_01940 [Thermofilaceae archaeon]|nr:hypothetical protein [Armatimonadota bacterium]